MAGQDYGFSKFAEQPFYQRVNRWMIESLNLGSNQRIVDLACGTGLLTRLIVEKVRGAKDTVVIGIDQSASALKQAMEDLSSARGTAVQFIQSRIENLSATVRGSVDTVVLGNGIHLIEDKRKLVSEVFGSLRPGGTFAFNSTFFEGGVPPESEQFYRRWMIKALRNLRTTYGLSPARDKVEARKQLSRQEYRELLESQGFTVGKEELVPVEVSLEGHIAISEYEDFVAGALPGVPLDKASLVLQEAARQTYEELKLTFVPRYWLQMVAVRPA